MSLPDVMIIAGRVPAVNVSVRYSVSVVCAASAGVHAVLVVPHQHEAGLRAASAFALSAFALAMCAVMLRSPQPSNRVVVLTLVVLLGTAGCYLLSRTTGIAPLDLDREGVDVLGIVTTAPEVLAAAAAMLLLHRKEHR
jgi:hypothetical protein